MVVLQEKSRLFVFRYAHGIAREYNSLWSGIGIVGDGYEVYSRSGSQGELAPSLFASVEQSLKLMSFG